MKKVSKYIGLFFGIYFLCLFTVNSISYKGIALENRAYLAYGTSLVEDFDLNIINNIMPNARWIVSESLNYPDMHFDGIVNTYLPFFISGKLIKSFYPHLIQTPRGSEDIYFFCAAVYSVFVFLFSLKVLSDLFFAHTTKDKAHVFLFLFSTPLIYYTFFDYTSSDVACFFLSCLILFWCLKKPLANKIDFFYHGALWGFAFILKPSFLFLLPLFVAMIFLTDNNYFSKKTGSHFGLFALGSSVLLILKLVNNFVKYNLFSLMSGYDYDFYVDTPDIFLNLKKVIWGPCGIIHQAPWILITTTLATYLLFNNAASKKTKIIICSILLMLWGKFFYEVLCLSDSESQFGYRRYILDIPFCCYIIFEFFNHADQKKKWFFYISNFLLALYSLFYFTWYINIDSKAGEPFGIYRMWESFPGFSIYTKLFHPFSQFNFFNYNAEAFVIALIALISFPILIFLANSKKYVPLIIALSLIYIPVTLSNVIWNKKNAARLQESNFFQEMVIANHMNVFLYDEILSELGKNILIAKYKKNWYEFSKSKAAILRYIASLNEHIVSDPINFIETNNKQMLRINSYGLGLNTESILNYHTKTYFNDAYDGEVR